MKFTHCYNMAFYKPNLWERLMLRFRPMQEYVTDTSVMMYKTLGNRIYVYGYDGRQGFSYPDPYNTAELN